MPTNANRFLSTLLTLLICACALLPGARASQPYRGLESIRERERLLALFRQQDEKAIPELVAALDSEIALPRRTAAHLLVRLGRPALPGIEKALVNPDFQVRRIAMHGLYELGLFNNYWSTILQDEHPSIRRETRLLFFDRQLPDDPAARDEFLAPFMETYRTGPTALRTSVVRTMLDVTPVAGINKQILQAATRDEDETIRKLAFPVIIDPVITRMRELTAAKDWQTLADEFRDEDIDNWPVTPAREIGSNQQAPEIAEASMLRGQAYRQLGAGAEAAADMQRAAQFGSPRFRANVFSALAGNYLSNMDDQAQAAAAYIKAFEVGAGGARQISPLISAVRLLRQLGRYQEALELLNRPWSTSQTGDYRQRIDAEIKAINEEQK